MNDFAECVHTVAGLTVYDKKTGWRYTHPKPTELEAWQELERVKESLAIAVRASLDLSSVVKVRFREGGNSPRCKPAP